MFSHYRKYLPNHFGLLLALGASLASVWLAAQSPTVIVIMHTNDIHGHLLPRNGVGGFAEMATIIRQAAPDLVLDAGDLFTGTFLSDEFKGEPIIRIMNRIGYTAATVGNHEFDYGQDALGIRAQEASFPFLSANLDVPIAAIQKYTVVAAKGLRFGIVGLTTEDIGTTTHPKNLGGVTVHSIVSTLEHTLPELRKQSDFIIVTAHLTDDEEIRVARAFPDVRLIVGGHNHSALGPIWVGETLIAKTGSIGRNVGRVDLKFTGKRLTAVQGELIPVVNVSADAEIAEIIRPFDNQVRTKIAERVGDASADLISSPNSESPLANLIADAFRERGKTQIGIQNLGGIRARILEGPITWGNVFEVLPFQNTMVTLRITGSQLKQLLNRTVLAVSGIRVRYNFRSRASQRLVSVTLDDGTPIEDRAFYSVTTNDFVVAGGDGLTELGRGQEIKDTGVLLRDVLVDYIKARRLVSPSVDGRLIIDR